MGTASEPVSRLRRNGTGVRKSPASRSGAVVMPQTLAATTDYALSAETLVCTENPQAGVLSSSGSPTRPDTMADAGFADAP